MDNATIARVETLNGLALAVYTPLTPFSPPTVKAETMNPSIIMVLVQLEEKRFSYSQLLTVDYNRREVTYTHEDRGDPTLLTREQLVQKAELLTAALGFRTISIDDVFESSSMLLKPAERVFWANQGYRWQPLQSPTGLPGESTGRWAKQV